MDKRILNSSNCTFTCPMLKGTISIEQSDHKFNDGNGTALTKMTQLSGNGICETLTALANGIPTSCELKKASLWVSGIELKKKINGVMLLNEDAKMPCPVGEMINATVIPIMPVTFVPSAEGSSASETSGSKASPDILKVSDKPVDIRMDPEDKSSSSKTHIADSQNGECSSEKDSMCSYETCSKVSNCSYAQAPSTIDTDKAALKLRKNSAAKEEAYNSNAQAKMDKYQISWNNQAHHMISINAAYCQYPMLVKLGNYFGYDINCQENCCFLPCWESGDGYGQKDTHFKKAQAYEVMKASGMQWHAGQHQYNLSDLPGSVLEKYPELRSMKCYNTRIHMDIKEVFNECNQRFDGKCLEENYEEHKAWFISRMNALSAKIERRLNLFSGTPKNSAPYFVSLEALKYAYEIPRSGKVILIYKTKTQVVLKRYQYTNYTKNDDIRLIFLDKEILAIAENRRRETIRTIALFCENVTCFLIVDEAKTFKLPFQYKVKCQYISEMEAEKKEIHFSAMLAEQVDSGEDEYISPKAMVSRRIKECESV